MSKSYTYGTYEYESGGLARFDGTMERDTEREREDRTQNEGFAKMVIHTGYIWLMVGISYPAFLVFSFVCLALILYICVRAHDRG